MTKDLKRKLYNAERSKIIPIWQGIKTAFNKAIPIRPKTFSAVSVENGVWEIMAEGTRIGGVFADSKAVEIAMRMMAGKISCHLVHDEVEFFASEINVECFTIILFES